MWRLSYRMLRAFSGAWFRLARRLTPAGVLVLGTLTVAAALGVDTNQTLAYQVFAFLAALLLASFVAARLARARFEAARDAPRLVTAGEAFSYRVTVRNVGRRPVDALTVLENGADPRPRFEAFRSLRFPSYRGWWRLVMQAQPAEFGEAAVPFLAPGAAAEVRIEGYAHRRGTAVLRGLTVARADPLGLVRGLARVDLPARIVVLPRRYAVPRVALGGSRRYQHGGVSLASSVGDSEEFIGLRDYRPGDPLQRIHWKSFARVGNPVVREYQDEFFERHALILDTFCTAPGAAQRAAFEEAVSIAASFACALDTQECLLDLLFVGAQFYCFTAGRGQLQAGQLVEILAGVRPCTDKPLQGLIDAVAAHRGALSGCIVILIAWDEQRRALIERLRGAGVPVLALAVLAPGAGRAERPAWLRVLEPGKIGEGLASL